MTKMKTFDIDGMEYSPEVAVAKLLDRSRKLRNELERVAEERDGLKVELEKAKDKLNKIFNVLI